MRHLPSNCQPGFVVQNAPCEWKHDLVFHSDVLGVEGGQFVQILPELVFLAGRDGSPVQPLGKDFVHSGMKLVGTRMVCLERIYALQRCNDLRADEGSHSRE